LKKKKKNRKDQLQSEQQELIIFFAFFCPTEIEKGQRARIENTDKQVATVVLSFYLVFLKKKKFVNATLRENLLKKHVVANTRSTFPNVSQIKDNLDSLHTQQHANLTISLIRMLTQVGMRKEKARENVYDWCWNMLMDCYNAMHDYKMEMYNAVADALHFDQILQQMNDNSNEDHSKCKQSLSFDLENQKYQSIQFMIAFHLQMYFEQLLQCPVPVPVRRGQYNDETKLDQIVRLIFTKYQKKMQAEGLQDDQDNELVTAYLKTACTICWTMVLQDHTLSLWPLEFRPTQSVFFDQDKHIMISGSNKISTHILYFVWPTIKRNDILLDTKVFVVK
ncbi:hypothetical protein RFI_34342, partial [Reticulomyxa filosa]